MTCVSDGRLKCFIRVPPSQPHQPGWFSAWTTLLHHHLLGCGEDHPEGLRCSGAVDGSRSGRGLQWRDAGVGHLAAVGTAVGLSELALFLAFLFCSGHLIWNSNFKAFKGPPVTKSFRLVEEKSSMESSTAPEAPEKDTRRCCL